jgi:exosortase
MKFEPRTGAMNVLATADQHLRGSPSPDGGVPPPRPFFPAYIYPYAFFAALLTSGIVFRATLLELVEVSTHSECSYIPLIPLISAFLILVRRDSIFEKAGTSPWLGSCIAAGGVVLWLARDHFSMDSRTRLELSALSVVTTWWGLFILCYGPQAVRRALLPLCLLLFMIPAPERVLNTVIGFLQYRSAVLSCELFRVVGVPALREGTAIYLSGVAIEVAPECSGIRSSVSLLILTLAVGDLYLRSGWNKALLVLAVVALSVVKNVIRIVTLTLLAVYVNPDFLTGPLHHRGGIVFFLITLTMLIPIVKLMRWLERRGAAAFPAGMHKNV